MAYGNQAKEYRKNAVLGASPAQLVVMLYDGALRFIEQGRAGMRAKDLMRQNDSLQRAQKIVAELSATLDRENGGEIATNLAALYDFVLNRLFEANIKDIERPLDEASATLRELRDAWAQIAAASPAPKQDESFGGVALAA